MRLTNVLRLAVLTGFLSAPMATAQGVNGEKLGTVIFPVSCSPAASQQFARAVAMLHSLWYEQAVKAFTEVALALNATAPPTDKTYANQLKAGAILEKVLTQQPNHPGVAHYLIHSYDSASFASRALPAARSYAKIAPSAPHALHMPGHIFTRLGLWQ